MVPASCQIGFTKSHLICQILRKTKTMIETPVKIEPGLLFRYWGQDADCPAADSFVCRCSRGCKHPWVRLVSKKKLNMTNRLSPSRIVPQDPKTLEPRKAFAPDAVFFARLAQTCKPEPTDLKNELLTFQLPVLSL